MSDTVAPTPSTAANQSQIQPTLNVLLQFADTITMENKAPWRILGAPENALEPKFHVDVKADKRTDTEFSVMIQLTISVPDTEAGSKEMLYKLDVHYGGIFEIQNANEEILPLLVFVQCPALLFPYLRALVTQLTQDSGLPPVNLNPINFFELFQQKVAQQNNVAPS